MNLRMLLKKLKHSLFLDFRIGFVLPVENLKKCQCHMLISFTSRPVCKLIEIILVVLYIKIKIFDR